MCSTTWQLTTAPCTRCSLDARLRKVFAAADGSTAPELDRLRGRLVQVDHPNYAITWLRKTNVHATITALAREQPKITHAAVDAMPSSKTLDHFRSMLVSVGALEFRDEGLMRVERESSETIARFPEGEHQRALRGFIDWHLMRRLRGQMKDRPASVQQVQNVRAHLVAADAFLRWLEGRGGALRRCDQADVETYLNTKPSYARQCSAFVRWAVRMRYSACCPLGVVGGGSPGTTARERTSPIRQAESVGLARAVRRQGQDRCEAEVFVKTPGVPARVVRPERRHLDRARSDGEVAQGGANQESADAPATPGAADRQPTDLVPRRMDRHQQPAGELAAGHVRNIAYAQGAPALDVAFHGRPELRIVDHGAKQILDLARQAQPRGKICLDGGNSLHERSPDRTARVGLS